MTTSTIPDVGVEKQVRLYGVYRLVFGNNRPIRIKEKSECPPVGMVREIKGRFMSVQTESTRKDIGNEQTKNGMGLGRRTSYLCLYAVCR